MKKQNELEFSVDAWLRVWVNFDEIKYHRDYEMVISKPYSDEEKIKMVKEIAVDIAWEKVSLMLRTNKDIKIFHEIGIKDIFTSDDLHKLLTKEEENDE